MSTLSLWLQYLFSGLFFGVICNAGRYDNEIGAVAGFVFGLIMMRLIELMKIHYKLQINKQSNENVEKLISETQALDD